MLGKGLENQARNAKGGGAGRGEGGQAHLPLPKDHCLARLSDHAMRRIEKQAYKLDLSIINAGKALTRDVR